MAQKRRGLLQDVLSPLGEQGGKRRLLGVVEENERLRAQQQHDQGEGAKTEKSPDREKDAHKR